MSMKEVLQAVGQYIGYIAMGTVACAGIFCAIFAPDAIFGVDIFFKILFMALISSGLFIVFYSRHILSKKQMRLRRILHFILLLCALSALALAWGWISFSYMGETGFFWILSTGVYIVINLIIGWRDKKTAGKMNERLEEIFKREKPQ